jgi:hypothetical protein
MVVLAILHQVIRCIGEEPNSSWSGVGHRKHLAATANIPEWGLRHFSRSNGFNYLASVQGLQKAARFTLYLFL